MANEQIKKYSYDVVAVYMTNIAKREDIIIIFTEIQEKNKQNTCRTKWQLQLYDTGLTVTKEDKLLSLFICKYSSRIPVLRRMSGRWVTTSCPCCSLSLAVEYKNDLGSLAFWLSGFLHSHLV